MKQENADKAALKKAKEAGDAQRVQELTTVIAEEDKVIASLQKDKIELARYYQKQYAKVIAEQERLAALKDADAAESEMAMTI